MEHSFELDLTWGAKIKELELIKKKKKTLDDLCASEQISRTTYEYLDQKLTAETADVETTLKSLSDSMTARAQELEGQISSLEISIANLVMYHAIGDIDDTTYESQNKTILLRLEAARQELKNVKNSLLNVLSETLETAEPAPEPETAQPIEETISEEQATPAAEEAPQTEPVQVVEPVPEAPSVTLETEAETSQEVEEEKVLETIEAEQTVAFPQPTEEATVEDTSDETVESVTPLSVTSEEVSAPPVAEETYSPF